MEGLKLVFVNFMAGFSGDFLTGKSLAGCLTGGVKRCFWGSSVQLGSNHEIRHSELENHKILSQSSMNHGFQCLPVTLPEGRL